MSDNRTTELREKLTERGVDYVIVDFGDASNVLTWVSSDAAWYYVEEQQRLFGESVTPEQAIAATLGSDDEYEAKMDALLCRLTNGKWSKSRSYDLDFMVSCIEEEFEAAELENGTYERIAELEQLIRDMYHEHPIYYFEQWMEDHGIEVER